MTPSSYFLAYASSATRKFSAQELVDLLAVARANNERANVTGMLLHRGGNFLQALEGPEASVRTIMEHVSRDRRHKSIVTLYEEPQDERVFADWTMAFEDVTKLNPADHPGLSYYLSRTEEDGAVSLSADHDVFEFFRAFREHMR